MKYSEITQLMSEADSWISTLMSMQFENTNLKNCLADVVKKRLDKEVLHKIEYYQSCFMGEDELIALMIFDVNKHRGLLDGQLFENKDLIDLILNKQKRLRKEIKKAEITFCKLKSDFTDYVSKI